MKKLHVNNNKVITEHFRGINFIHQLYNYMPDKENRMNTPELIELEHETLRRMGVKQVRSFYGSSLSWDAEKGVHDFESVWMQAFYKNCKDMEKLGIEIGITPQWHLDGLWRAKDGEQGVNLGYNGCFVPDDEETTARNFAKFIKESVEAFERHGITNIKYWYCFTECNNSMLYTKNGASTSLGRRCYNQVIHYYDLFVRAVDQGLKDAGMRDRYKIVGPCDNWRADDGSEPYSILTKHTAEHLADVVDIIGSHNGYDRADSFDQDAFYDIPFPKLTDPKERAIALGKEYWADEFNVALHSVYSATEHRQSDNNPMRGVALGALVNSIMNMGYVHNVVLWALYSQQWPNWHNGGEKSEFVDGVQIVGYINNLRESTVPHNAWYACSLLSRYVGEGKVYDCVIDRPLYISAIDRTDGEFTVVVTCYQDETTDIEVTLANGLHGKNLYRYLYDPKTVQPTAGCDMIDYDKVKTQVDDCFTDTLPGYCVAIYTTEKPNNM